MKRAGLGALVLFAAGLSAPAAAQPGSRDAAADIRWIAADEVLDGKVLRIQSPLLNSPLRVAWIRPDGAARVETVYTRKGRHSYDLRHVPDWEGRVRGVGIDVQGQVMAARATGQAMSIPVEARLARPGLGDHLDLFWAPEQFLPSSMHFHHGYRLFGVRWNHVLAAVVVVGAAAGRLRGRTGAAKGGLVAGLLAAAFAAALLQDLRGWRDHAFNVLHADAMTTIRTRGLPARAVDEYRQRLAEEPFVWEEGDLPYPVNLLVRYHLAEAPSRRREDGFEPRVRITADRGQLVFQRLIQ